MGNCFGLHQPPSVTEPVYLLTKKCSAVPTKKCSALVTVYAGVATPKGRRLGPDETKALVTGDTQRSASVGDSRRAWHWYQ
jgi:hypothetical protein